MDGKEENAQEISREAGNFLKREDGKRHALAIRKNGGSRVLCGGGFRA